MVRIEGSEENWFAGIQLFERIKHDFGLKIKPIIFVKDEKQSMMNIKKEAVYNEPSSWFVSERETDIYLLAKKILL